MQRYNGQLINQFANVINGNAAAGAQITVRVKSSGSIAALYATDSLSGAALSNPLTADSKGYYGFYAPDGVYTLDVSISGTPQLEIQLQDVAALQAQFDDALANAGYIPVGTFAAGCTVSQSNGIVSDGSSFWRWDGALPKTVTAGSEPTPTGVGGWILISDQPLREDLADANSTVEIAEVEAVNVARVARLTVTPEMYSGDINATCTAAGANGVVTLKPSTVYTIDRKITMLDGQKIVGNGATIKRANQAVTTTTTAITSGATTSVTLTSASGFAVGQEVAFAQNGVARSALVYGSTLSVKRTITNIAGNVITLNSAPNINVSIGGTCFLAFSSVEMGEDCEISGLNFDGNRANWSYNRWEVISEISTVSGKNGQSIRGNLFEESPSESILPYGDNIKLSGNLYRNIGGNAIHLSGVVGATIAGEIATTGNLDTAVGHADGFISFSNDNANVIISGCIADTFISGVGALNNTDSQVTISDCDFMDMYCFGIEGGAGITNLTIDNVRIDNVPTNVSAKTGSPYYGGIVLIALSGDSVSISDTHVTNTVGTYKSIAVSSSSAAGVKITASDFYGDALFSGLSDFDISGNDFYGAVILGTSTDGKFIENDITLPSTSGVCLSLNSSGAYTDVRVAGGSYRNGVYGISLTTSASSYTNVSFDNVDLINQSTRGFSFDAYAGTLVGMSITNNNVVTGASSGSTYNGIVCSTNGVSIRRNTLVDNLAASSRVGISTAGAASNALTLIYGNEVRGNWLHNILPATSSGVNIAYNFVDAAISNPTGNTLTGNIVF